MKKPKNLQGRDAEQIDVSATSEIDTSIPEQMGSEGVADEQIDLHKRASLRRFGIAALLGTALVATSPSKANADELNPVQDKLAPVLRQRLTSKETAPEKMSQDEALIMDDAMQVLFKAMYHFSFWASLASDGKKDEAKKAMETAMNHKNRGKFWYRRGENGVITVEKRGPGSPDVFIEIKDGVIAKINDFEIGKNWSIEGFDKDWENMEKRIRDISGKFAYDPLHNEVDPETGKPPRIADWEYGTYSQYSMAMPKTVLRCLMLKGDLTEEEERVRKELEKLLKNHPESMDDLDNSSKEADESDDSSIRKKPSVIVIKRRGYKSIGELATPKGIYEIARFGGSNEPWKPVAYISKEGFVMVIKDKKFVKSDNREHPFADMLSKKTGVLLNNDQKLEQECSRKLAGNRPVILGNCGGQIDCANRNFAKSVRACVANKLLRGFTEKRQRK